MCSQRIGGGTNVPLQQANLGFSGLNSRFSVSRPCATNTIAPACRTAAVCIHHHERHSLFIARGQYGFDERLLFDVNISQPTDSECHQHEFEFGASFGV
jgi:hypothetical protein